MRAQRLFQAAALSFVAMFVAACGGGSGSIGAGGTGGTGSTTQPNYLIGDLNGIVFSNGAVATTSIAQGSSYTLHVDIVNGNNSNALVTSSLSVSFSSPCISAGTSTLGVNPVVTTSGSANATYTVGTCTGSDPITATVIAPDGKTLIATGTVTIQGGSGGGGSGGTGATVATVTLLTSSPQLSSSASDPSAGITLTAIVKDANQNVIAGQSVSFATHDSATIIVTQATTDASGQAKATVTTGGDPQNRNIHLTAAGGNQSGTVSVAVVGTTLSVSGPTNAQYGTPAMFSALLADSSGKGIANSVVQVASSAGNTLSATSLTSDSSGTVTVTVTGSNTAVTTDTLTFSALGISATKALTFSPDSFVFTTPSASTQIPLNASQTIQVVWKQGATPVAGHTVNFSSTRGVITASATTDANGQASATLSSTNAGPATIQASSPDLTKPSNTLAVQFIATTPSRVDLQPSPAVIATNQQSDINAVVRDANNNLVTNAVVDFTLNDVTNGSISAPTAVTNTQGLAKVTYTAGSTSSASNGVTVAATVRGTSVTGSTSLTVGSQALRITLGTGNEITEPNQTTYQFPYSAIVTDSNGNPVPSANFTLGVLSLSYGKGYYKPATGGGNPTQVITATCANEDTNHNGILDPGEDTNGNGVLDPGNVAEVPSTVALDSDGSAQFNIKYPQDRGNWVTVGLTAKATVSGTESVENRTVYLPISVPDESNPPGSPSPYGVSSDCTNPN